MDRGLPMDGAILREIRHLYLHKFLKNRRAHRKPRKQAHTLPFTVERALSLHRKFRHNLLVGSDHNFCYSLRWPLGNIHDQHHEPSLQH